MTSRMRRLTEAATPAPWRVNAVDGRWWVEVRGSSGNDGWDYVTMPRLSHEADAAFIAASRSFVPLALDVIEAARTHARGSDGHDAAVAAYRDLLFALARFDEWDKETPE